MSVAPDERRFHLCWSRSLGFERTMFRFRITTLLFLITIVSLGIAWYVDRTALQEELQRKQHSIATYPEKHGYWSPSLHLNTTTNQLESLLTPRIGEFSGPIVESSQGMSHEALRQPSLATIDEIVPLLADPHPATRLTAARLVALYLEAASGKNNSDSDSIRTRAYLHAAAEDKVQALLNDPDAAIRAAGAFIAGNLYYSRKNEQMLKDAFDKETDGSVRQYLAWAYHHLAD